MFLQRSSNRLTKKLEDRLGVLLRIAPSTAWHKISGPVATAPCDGDCVVNAEVQGHQNSATISTPRAIKLQFGSDVLTSEGSRSTFQAGTSQDSINAVVSCLSGQSPSGHYSFPMLVVTGPTSSPKFNQVAFPVTAGNKSYLFPNSWTFQPLFSVSICVQPNFFSVLSVVSAQDGSFSNPETGLAADRVHLPDSFIRLGIKRPKFSAVSAWCHARSVAV